VARRQFPITRRLMLAAAISIVVAGSPCRAVAQITTVANLVVGDGVIGIKTSPDKQIYVGVGGAGQTVTITVDPPAAQEFVAEATQLVRRGTRPIPTDVSDHPVLEERTTGRSLSITRRVELESDNSKELTYHLYVSDEKLRGFTIVATADETKAVLAALKSAAHTADAEPSPGDSEPPHPQRPIGIPLPDGN
jgi:hypothetical protein